VEPEHGDGGGGGLDRKDVDVWENQVYFTMSGWGKPGVTSSRGPFTDKEGTEKRTMDGLDEDVAEKRKDGEWMWEANKDTRDLDYPDWVDEGWELDDGLIGDVDDNGWQYAAGWNDIWKVWSVCLELLVRL
jgi:hypothetical protein